MYWKESFAFSIELKSWPGQGGDPSQILKTQPANPDHAIKNPTALYEIFPFFKYDPLIVMYLGFWPGLGQPLMGLEILRPNLFIHEQVSTMREKSEGC